MKKKSNIVYNILSQVTIYCWCVERKTWWNWHNDKEFLLETINNAKLLSKEGEGYSIHFSNVLIFKMWTQLHIIETLFMFVTMFLFSKVGYMHLATTLHLKVGNWQQCLFQRSVICIFTKMFSREVTYIFQGFVSKVGYMHLWQHCSLAKVDYMCIHYNNVLSRGQPFI